MQFTNNSAWNLNLIDKNGEFLPLTPGNTVGIGTGEQIRLRFAVEQTGRINLEVHAGELPADEVTGTIGAADQDMESLQFTNGSVWGSSIPPGETHTVHAVRMLFSVQEGGNLEIKPVPDEVIQLANDIGNGGGLRDGGGG